MKMREFAHILTESLLRIAADHGQSYPPGGARAWGQVGASYLGFALCNLPSGQLRTVQYSARGQFGAVILDCKWYDRLKTECLDGKKSVQTLLPGPHDTLCECTVTDELFLEMLDFCREG